MFHRQYVSFLLMKIHLCLILSQVHMYEVFDVKMDLTSREAGLDVDGH